MITCFGDYELDHDHFELRRGGDAVAVERRVFDLILYLASHTHRVISKAELLREVWQGRHVAEGSLSVAIAAARRVLGDDAASQRVIRTRHGRGYQFVAPCTAVNRRSAVRSSRSSHAEESRSDFVGREEAVGELTLAAERLLLGHSTLLLVSGEPGIGKTRLVDEFLLIAHTLSLVFCTGRCAESGNAPAMWPWSQIIHTLSRRRQDDWIDTITNRAAQALAMIAPETLRDQIQSRSLAQSTELSRFQLYESLLESLERLIADEMVVIALDDLHRADSSTLGFFQFAARELRHHPILFIATHRITDLHRSSLHSRVLIELAREPHAVQISLEGLNSGETTRLFTSLCGQELSPESASLIYAKTGGNPFFIRQLSTLTGSVNTVTGQPGEATLPSTLRHAILAQISGLTAGARALLPAASVIGREFSLHTLADVVSIDRLEFDAGLDELLDSRVLRRDEVESSRLLFAHIMVRDALYEQLGRSDRKALHERVGRSLAAKYGTASEVHMAAIAHHLFEAQSPQSLFEAQILSEAAARAAAARSAHDDAACHYTRALRAQELIAPANANERCRLLLALGTEHCRAGNRTAAAETFTSAAALARSLGTEEDLARAALGVAPGFLAAEAGAADAFLVRLLTEALAAVGHRNLALRARVAARLAISLHWSDSVARMQESASIARELSEQLNEPGVRLHVNFARWFCEWHHSEQRSRAQIAEAIEADAATLRNSEMTLAGTMLRLVGMLERGETAAFDASLETFARMAANLRQPNSLWYELLFRSMRALLEGNFDLAERLQSEFQAVAARVQDANATNSLIMQSTLLRWEMGTLDSMITLLSQGAYSNPTLRGFRAALSWAHCKLGRRAEARKEFDVLASCSFSDVPERFDWTIEIALCAEVCSDLGDQRNARVLYNLLRPLEQTFLVLGLGVLSFGSVDRLLARLSETMGHPDQAELHFQAAIDRNAAAGAHAWTAHTKLDYASFLSRFGGSARRDYRVRMASEALEIAFDLGMINLRGRASAFLQASDSERARHKRS